MDQCASGSVSYAVLNVDRGITVARQVRLASTSRDRRTGLLGVDSLAEDAGLWIVPCEAIHTFGMKMPIDVLFLDKEFRVRKLLSGLAPWRIGACMSASSVLELAAGSAARSSTKPGDRLTFERV